MTYNITLADRVREYLLQATTLPIKEKKMFGGLAFMVDNKMCINVSGDNLMCRFDPNLLETVAEKNGYMPMIMRGKQLKGYCYVNPDGFRNQKDLKYWVHLCLAFNGKAKRSRK